MKRDRSVQRELSLDIPSPCGEDWKLFEARPGGRFCASCSKVVVDFTSMSDDEIVHYFNQPRGTVCGLLKTDQLKTYPARYPTTVGAGFGAFKAGLMSVLLLLSTKTMVVARPESPRITAMPVDTARYVADTEVTVVQGRVLSGEDGAPLAGVSVVVKGTTHGTISDYDGYFSIAVPEASGRTLVISFIGYLSIEHMIRDSPVQNPGLEFRMVADVKAMTEVVVVAGMVSTSCVLGPAEPAAPRSLWQRVKNLFRTTTN